MPKKIAKPEYKCLRCKVEFTQNKCGPINCIKCGYNYLKWINYDNETRIERMAA